MVHAVIATGTHILRMSGPLGYYRVHACMGQSAPVLSYRLRGSEICINYIMYIICGTDIMVIKVWVI